MPFKVLKIGAHESTSLDAIRERGEVFEAADHRAAAAAWCSEHEADFHSLTGSFELAVADDQGRHEMFTVEPVCRLNLKRSAYQGLS